MFETKTVLISLASLRELIKTRGRLKKDAVNIIALRCPWLEYNFFSQIDFSCFLKIIERFLLS